MKTSHDALFVTRRLRVLKPQFENRIACIFTPMHRRWIYQNEGALAMETLAANG
jgi:hypothetical protein